MSNRDRPILGVGLRILSGLLFAGMFISVKAVSDTLPLGQIVFFRSFFAIFPLIGFLWVQNEFPSGLATRRPSAHLMRASLGALALFGSFAAIARLTLAEAILVSQLSPILMAIGASILLSERLNKWRIWGLSLGFAGVVVLVWPELTGPTQESGRLLGYIIGIAAAALGALSLILVRNLNKTENPGAIAFYFVLASIAGSVATLPFGWVMPDVTTLAFLILSGLFGGCAHIAMTLAFRYAEASRLAPFEYLALLWPILADVFIFRLSLSIGVILAAPLILVGAMVAALENGKRTPRKQP